MDPAHKNLLRKNRTRFVGELDNIDDILDPLLGPGVLTEGMKEEIESKPTKDAKVRELLDKLPKRGPNAFRYFCEALWQCDNPHLAKLLDPQGAFKHPDDSDEQNVPVPSQTHYAQASSEPLPKNWPDETVMDSRPVRTCDLKGQVVTNKYRDQDRVYSMTRNPRGRVLVINNEKFNPEGVLSNRMGTRKDEEDIKRLFKELHFDVQIATDLTALQISKIIDQECKNHAHKDADCFVMVIMTHGDTKDNVDVIYGVDGESVNVEDGILQKFQECENLNNKPKVFLFQACRGKEKDEGKVTTLYSKSEGGVMAANLSEKFGKLSVGDSKGTTESDATESDAVREKKIPTKADFLIATATTAGKVSWRNTELGSWFIQAIVYIFQRFAHEDDIDSMLKLVNNLVSKGVAEEKSRDKKDGVPKTQESKTVSEYRSTLTKSLYFFPGVYDPGEKKS